jgi:hypothetical protein
MRKFVFKEVDYHFRNRTNPRTKTYFNLVASRNYSNILTYKLIERVKKQLFARATVFASPNNFTLVNVTNLMSGISYGFASEPVNVLYFDDKLAFTFALTANSDLKYSGEPAFINRITREVTMWGYASANEYVTVNVDIGDIAADSLSIKDYEYLYLVVGSVTKNFAMFRDVANFSTDLDRNSIVSFYTMYFNLDLASLFYTVPYRYWVFNRAIWENSPELLAPSSINAYSALYYAVFLSTKTLTAKYTANLEGTKHLLNELYKFYLASQKMLIRNQVGETNVDEEHEYIISFIYPSAVYCIFHMLSVPGTSTQGLGYREWKPKARLSNFYEWLNSMSVRMQEDLFIHPDIQFLAQMPNLCRDAVINRLSSFRKAAVILAGQAQHEMFTQH